MASVHGKDAFFSWNSVTLSTYTNQITESLSTDSAETSTMGLASKTYLPGLRDGTFSISGIFDGAAGLEDATLAAGYLANTIAAFEFRANSAVVGVNNPKFTGNAFITSYEVDAGIGDAVSFSADFQVTGNVTRATS